MASEWHKRGCIQHYRSLDSDSKLHLASRPQDKLLQHRIAFCARETPDLSTTGRLSIYLEYFL